jgi:multicomponent K+:H+ antiporter subunit G
MSQLLEVAVAFCIIAGATFSFVGSLGLAKLPDFFMRLHGPTKASTLGVGLTLIGSMLFFSPREPGVSMSELLVALFLMATAPVSAHLLAKAAMHSQVKRVERTKGEPWDQ